jgi:hypothetical protein
MNKKLINATLKDRFIRKICKEKGWNIDILTTGQMLYIINHPDFKNVK